MPSIRVSGFPNAFILILLLMVKGFIHSSILFKTFSFRQFLHKHPSIGFIGIIRGKSPHQHADPHEKDLLHLGQIFSRTSATIIHLLIHKWSNTYVCILVSSEKFQGETMLTTILFHQLTLCLVV